MSGLLSSLFQINAQGPDNDDTVAIAICAGVFCLTALMLVFAWCNYSYRPIRAKNLVWTTLIYLSTLLWFIGNIPANGHVRLLGAWSNCKLWIIWFRVFFCFVFASMTIVRFYAVDRVFNQKKPFTAWSSLVAAGAVIVLNVIYCLVNQLISGSLTVEFVPSLEVCNVTQAFRIAALTFQWVLWTGVGILFFRLRNIQSSFNEFRESMAIFAVIIALLVESTVTNIHYKYYILEKHRRIEKTVVDMAAANIVVWLFIGYPVFMCIFRRREYETRWLEKLAKDSPNSVGGLPRTSTSYAKMKDNGEFGLGSTHQDFDGSDLGSTLKSRYHPFANQHPLNIEDVLNGRGGFNDNTLPIALRTNIHVHEPALSSPTMFSGYSETTPDGRHVL
ncbi:hypothetical protein H4R24_005024 [Coemansia sp. RSA 988]|nr:hypothetical protein H4R24_005024 [Coemansia sp. RSA 988]